MMGKCLQRGNHVCVLGGKYVARGKHVCYDGEVRVLRGKVCVCVCVMGGGCVF